MIIESTSQTQLFLPTTTPSTSRSAHLGTSGGLDELRPQADAVPLGLHQLEAVREKPNGDVDVDHQQMGI